MIGKFITARAGRAVSESLGGSGGTGAMLGAMVPILLPRLVRRLGPGGWLLVTAGTLALNRHRKKQARLGRVWTFPGAPDPLGSR